ncbi:MAG TPA: phosphopantetheine-binding protein [Verrucomicrobiae bacterium]|nr:phosphopantetheine-binding protein [Verrucomicrobiae bacterium]
MNVTLTENDLADLKEGLRRCRPETVEAAIRFREQGDLDAIPQIVYGILERYQPATATIKLAEASQDTRLIEDLGLDSLTLLEIVLAIEEVLKLRIENEELREIRTLRQLNNFLHAKITGAKTEVSSKRYTREHIALVLPQQPPFLFLDDAELNGETLKATYTIKGTESFLEGHFRDEPVFPASIVFEAMGQAACLWVLEKAPILLGKEIKSNRVFFASLDGAHFYRKTRPGEKLEFSQKLVKLREPLAIFEGAVTANGERVAKVERLVLAFGEQLLPEEPATATEPSGNAAPPAETPDAVAPPEGSNGSRSPGS